MTVLADVLVWVLPPLLGAIIGYVTNAIAIRMLFRPLTEKRIFGMRLPLTPGLIPRERGDLAESMARMVSTELLTEEAVRRQIHAPSFQDSVTNNITAVTSQLLDTTLATVGASLFPRENGSPRPEGLISSVGSLLASAFGGITKSASFTMLVKDLIRHLVDELAGRPVNSVLGSSRSIDGVVARMLGSLTSEEGRTQIRDRVSAWVRQLFERNASLTEFLSEEDVDAAARFVDSVYPDFVKFFVKWLRSEGTKRELSIRGRFLVQDIVDRLNGFQRFIITAAQYQRTLDENMDGIIDDALDSIEEAGMDPDTRRRLVEVVGRELGTIRGRGLADVAEKHEEAIERTAGVVAERAAGVLNQPDLRRGLLDAVAGSGDQTIGALLDRILGLEGGNPGDFLVDLIFPEAGARADSDEPQRAVTMSAAGDIGGGGAAGGIPSAVMGFARSFVEAHGEMSVRELLGMDESAKAGFDRALATSLIATVDARVPDILETINIHDLVVSKINGLNIEEVEGLLLRVIEKHLRWINIFGALLGGLIGFIQDGLRLLNLAG